MVFVKFIVFNMHLKTTFSFLEISGNHVFRHHNQPLLQVHMLPYPMLVNVDGTVENLPG